jgi:hypothetical protein
MTQSNDVLIHMAGPPASFTLIITHHLRGRGRCGARRASASHPGVPVAPCLCVYLSLCLCVPVSLLFCVYVSLLFCVSVSLCLCDSVALCVVVYVYLCMCVSVSLCIRLSVYMCTCMSVPLFLCGSVSLCMFVCLCVCLCVCFSNERAHNTRHIATRQMSEYTTNERNAATLHDLDKPILHILWYTISGRCYTTNERVHNK